MNSDRKRLRRVLRAALEAGVARPRAAASIAVLAGCGVLSTLVSLGAQAQVPVPCSGGACNSAAFANTVSGRPTATYSAAGNRATVQQNAPKAILNWQSFNVGAGNTVEFRQPDASSVALNRIHQGSPSQIRGQLSANGQVYLINQNGIVFGAGAQINVHSLVASSLTVSDPDFINGILGPINEFGGGRAAFVPFRDAGGTIQPSGAVRVEAGAVLESKAGGRVMILAPVVENRGEIRTPDGQAILGAGNHVYLQASQDPNLRGLLIEVDTQGDVPGTVSNVGRIVADRGNATLIGLAVNQMGRVSATTSVNVNGSVRLLARSGAEQNANLAQNPQVRIASTTGALTLGPGSVTEVQPEAAGGDTTVRSSVFNADGSLRSPSRIELMGDRIALQAGASVVAPAGDIRVTALKDPRQYNEAANALVGATRTDSRIHLDTGSRIDAAGTNALVPMERNQLEVELRGSELRDKPLQRDGILRGKTITIDVRKGTQLADVQGAIDNAPIGVEEKTVAGGRIALKSDGDIVTSAGSVIDASGGSVRFADGYVKTTKLISGNRIYDVSVASPDRVYDSFADSYEVKHPKWGERATQRWTAASGAASGAQFYSGYVEGRDAGTIELRGYGLALGGDLRAARTPGDFQRDSATLPQLGRLVIGAGEQLDLVSGLPNFATPDVRIVAQARARAVAQGDASIVGETVELPIALLRDGGFGRVEIYGNGTIRQENDAPLDVPPGGAVVMIAREIDVQGAITARSGSITLATRSVADEPPGATHRLAIGATTVLDTRGLWVNDGPAAAATGRPLPLLLDGGAVSIASIGELVLPRGSLIDVSGGGGVNSKGELLRNKDSSLPRGDAGAISLTLPPGTDLGTELRAAALGKGGTLTLGADDIVIGAGTGSALGTHVVAPDFLQTGGFSSATLNAQHSLKVEPGVRVDLRATNLVPGADAAAQASGADVRSFAPLGALDDSKRLPVTLNLAVVGPYGDGSGVLEIGAGAQLLGT